MDLISTFDIKAYLNSRNIEYRESGKNVSDGWVEINCLFCDDPSFHLGINTDTTQYPEGGYHCWRCGESGNITNLIQHIEGGYSRAQANTIISKFQLTEKKEKQIIIQNKRKLTLPKEAKQLSPYHTSYLRKRGFDPNYLIRKYKIRGVYNIGKWKFRIIVPIYMKGKLVNFIGMDASRQSRAKYKFCPNDEAVIPAKQCLYNIDSVKDTAIIVEGVTDVWRIGDGAVALFGMEYTREQLNLLKNLNKVVVMLDAGEREQQQAEKLAYSLSGIVPNVSIATLTSGDPCDLDEEEILRLRKDVFGEG